jgi:hypothetical protein
MKPDWIKLVDKYWFGMSEESRKNLFEDWTSTPEFRDMLDKEEVKLFFARFNPDNQFTVTTELYGTVNKHQAFKWKDGYYLGSMSKLNDEYITDIEKINFNKDGNTIN